MKKKKLFSRIVGITVLSAMLSTTVFPSELLAAKNTGGGVSEAQVSGEAPEAETEKVPETTGTVYHADSNTDVPEGERDGTKEKPFKELEEVNDIELQPGDGISLKCGSVFDDQTLAPKGKGTEDKPIVIGTYGEGDRPVIHAGGFRKTGKTNPDGTPEYAGHKEAVLIENMEYVWVTGLEVTNDDVFGDSLEADDPANWRTTNRGANIDKDNPRRLGIHITIDERAEDTYKSKKGDKESRAYKGIVIDNCYIHDVDGNENRQVNKVDGGIGVETIFSGKKGIYPYFDGITLQNNRIHRVDRTGIKLARISDLDNFLYPEDPNCDVDDNGANDGSRRTNIRQHDQASRNIRVVGNYVSSVGGDGILVCESDGAVVEHNILDGNAMRVLSGNANAGIWQWNAFNTVFRYNESFHGPDYNQDGCSFDSDYNSGGTIFEYNYSHDVPMGFMLLMGGNDLDVIRYNLSQNDGVAWRHGAGGTNTQSYIYNNVFYYDGANWLFNHSNNNGAALGNGANWAMYNNIFYNYNPDSVSKWTSRSGYEVTEADWKNTKLGGNLVYEAGGKHSPGEIPGAIQADPKFLKPGGAEGDEVEKKDSGWSTNWESLKAYGLAEDSPARNAGVYVDVVPSQSGDNTGHIDMDKEWNAAGDFFGNPLYDGAPDIGIVEMSNDGSKTEYTLESNASYKLRGEKSGTYVEVDGKEVSLASGGSSFVLENAKDGYKLRIWDVEDSSYYYLDIQDGKAVITKGETAVWSLEDQHNGLHRLVKDGKVLGNTKEGALAVTDAKETEAGGWYFEKQEQSKAYNVGGAEIPGFSADQKYDEAKKQSGYATEDLETVKGSGGDVYATGRTGSEIEYKIYASDAAHNLKLYVSENGVKGRTFNVLVNGELVKERYVVSEEKDVLEIADVYPADGVITVKLQNEYSETAGEMTDPVLNGIVADAAPMGEVNLRLNAGSAEGYDGLFADASFEENGKSGYYEIDGKKTETVSGSTLPVPDAGMGTVLKTARIGEHFGYKFKVSPGAYRAKLYFNDTSSEFTPDAFSVTINGKTVKENFNISEAAGGKNKAVDITAITQAKDSLIDIQLQAASGGKAMVNAVVVEPYKDVDKENLVTQENISADQEQEASMAAKYAADNNQSTRWSSGSGDGHWIQARLDKKYMIDTVMLDWTPGAYATKYRVEAAEGDGEWSVVKRVSGAAAGLNIVEFDPVQATKIRVVAEAYNDKWGMSMTEFGVYGEEVTGEAGITANVTAKSDTEYEVEVGLENIYQKYRSAIVSFTYDPEKMTLAKEAADLNADALFKTGDAVEADNDDGTKTTAFNYGIKDQAAFKKAAQAMTGAFTVKEGATRSEVKVDVSLSNAEGHVTELETATAYVPNTFTYEDLQALIKEAEDLLNGAEVGTIPGTYPQEAKDMFAEAVASAKAVKEDEEAAVYEKAYLALEKAMKTFKNSENKPLYSNYHKDFLNKDETVPTVSAGTGAAADGRWNLKLGTKQVAKLTDAPKLDKGYYYLRLKIDNTGDQNLFGIYGEDGARRVRSGWESSHWFWDGSNNGWGEWGGGDAIAANKDLEFMMQFDASEGDSTQTTLWINGKKVATKDLPYTSGTGIPALETRNTGKTYSVEELYFTDSEPVTIDVSASGKGSVSQEGAVTSFVEANKTFYFTPEEDAEIKSVKVDGEAVDWNTKDNSYTFSYLQEGHTLEVEFTEEETPTPPEPAETVVYHQDYMVDQDANYTGSRMTVNGVKDGALSLKLEGKTGDDNNFAIAMDQNAKDLDEGTLYVRFSADSVDDQVLFDLKTDGITTGDSNGRIRIGFEKDDKGGRKAWFYDKASGAYGDFPTTVELQPDTEHEVKIDFAKASEGVYDVTLTVDGKNCGTLTNLNYGSGAGKFAFGARRSGRTMEIKEVYYTNAAEHKIQVTAGEGGKVSQEGAVTTFEGASKTLFVTPDEGYKVDKVLVNGEEAQLADGTQYTFLDIKSGQTFEATFKESQAAVDKTGLQTLVDEAKALNEADYTAKSWAAMQTALAGAEEVLNNTEADQAAVDQAKADLQSAIDALTEVVSADKSALEVLYNEYKDMQNDGYTEESWQKLSDAREQAEAALANEAATEEQIKEAYNNLTAAVNALEKEKTADKSALEETYNTYKDTQQGNYTDESWAAFQNALAKAKEILDNAEATQEEIDAAKDALITAAEGLTEKEAGNSSELLKLFNENQNRTEADYTADTWKVFAEVMQKADEVLKNAGAAQEQIDNAYANLKAAVEGLKEKPKPEEPDYTIVEGAGQEVSKDKGAKFKVNVDIEKFEKVLVDGKEIAPENYTVSEGSTIVTLKKEYLASLKEGTHTISIVFKDGTAEGKFTVVKSDVQNPEDGKKPSGNQPTDNTKPSGSKPSGDSGTSGSGKPSANSGETGTPQSAARTGDTSMPILWLALGIVSLGAVFGGIVWKVRRRNTK